MLKHVNLVDLVKSFPTNMYLQNLASIQKRTSALKFAHLAEKSANGSVPNLSTKAKSMAKYTTEPSYSSLHYTGNRADLKSGPKGVRSGGLAGLLSDFSECKAKKIRMSRSALRIIVC